MTPHDRIQLDLERHTLDNGLRVVFHRDETLPLVTVNLWYHVGSKNEQPGLTGLAHLFEHMLFQGSEHVGTNDHFRYLQQVGGVANGSTWYDRTNYYETLPSHQLELALWLESDRMGYLLPAMSPEKLETQREVVMNERRQRVDNQPYGRAFERLHELLYPPDHPYHWPVIGYMEDIAAATLEDVRSFFRTHYTPNNSVLTLAGAFDPGHALDRIDAYFGTLPRGPEPPAVEIPPEAPVQGIEEVLEDDVRLPRIYVGLRAPGLGHPDWYAADLLSSVLTAGKSSVLHRDLVYEREIAQDVSSFVLPTKEAATLAIIATARPGVRVQELEAALLAHLDRSAAESVGEADLERARNRNITDLFTDLQKLDRRADLLSQLTTFFDDPARLADEADRYRGVTAAEIQRFTERCAAPGRRVVLRVVPQEG